MTRLAELSFWILMFQELSFWNLKHCLEVWIVIQSLSHVWLFATPWTEHARLPCPSLSAVVCSNSCALSWWYHPTILSSVIPFSTCPQSFSAWEPFPVGLLFASGGQSIWVSASSSVLPMNIQDWFPLGWTGLISLQARGLSREVLIWNWNLRASWYNNKNLARLSEFMRLSQLWCKLYWKVCWSWACFP